MEVKTNEKTEYKFIMVGTGATGSQLLPFLAQLLNYYNKHSIVLIDGDIVENKNIRNQKFLESDIGKHKAEVLAERYQSVYPNLDISYSIEYIKDADKIKNHVVDGPLKPSYVIPVLVSCVDNNASRKIFDKLFYDEDVKELIYVDSGNGTLDRIGQIVIGYKEGKRVQDTEDTFYYRTVKVPQINLNPVCDVFPAIREDDDLIENHTGCSRVEDSNPQNIGTNIYAAANVFNILNNIVSFNSIPSQVIYFNSEKSECISREVISKNE